MSAARQAAIDAAVRGVLSAQLRDYQRGAITREDLEEVARRRANGIRASFKAASAAAGTLRCGACRSEVAEDDAACINGAFYCRLCAPRFRMLPPARRCA